MNTAKRLYFLTVCLFLVLFTVQVPTVPEEATIVRTLGKILPSPHGLRHARKQEHNPADIHSLGGWGWSLLSVSVDVLTLTLLFF